VQGRPGGSGSGGVWTRRGRLFDSSHVSPSQIHCRITATVALLYRDEPKAASAAAGEVFDGKSKGERGCVTTRPGSAKMESREEDRKGV
jgi:hypothetical protein